MPKPTPKLESAINNKALTDVVRTQSGSKWPQKPESKPVHGSSLTKSQASRSRPTRASSEVTEQSNSKKPPTHNSSQCRSSKVVSITEEERDQFSSPAPTIRPSVGNGVPPYGNPLPDGEFDPFLRVTQDFKHQLEELREWFDKAKFKKSVVDETTTIRLETVDTVTQKRLFIHAERRVMTALRENHILRIQGNMSGADIGVCLRAFADTDILNAEEKHSIFELDDWDSVINDQDLDRSPKREMLQATIVAMAKIYRHIQTQNNVLADEAAEWRLICAWIDDAPARLAYSPPYQPAEELDELRLGACVLLEGACKIIDDLEQCVQSFETTRAQAIALEKETRKQYGPLGRFKWNSYDVKLMFYNPLPAGFADLWCTTEQQVRGDFKEMVDERGCTKYASDQKKYRRDLLTQSLAVGAKWIHQVDGQVTELQRLMRARQGVLE